MSILEEVGKRVDSYIEKLEKKKWVKKLIEKDGARETWKILKDHKGKFVPVLAMPGFGKIATIAFLAGAFCYFKFFKKKGPV